MIFVVEVPHQGVPHAWFAFDGEDLLQKVAADDPREAWEIHDLATPRELFDLLGISPESEDVAQQYPGLHAVAQEHGLDTVLSRADYVVEPGSYNPELISVERACHAALLARTQATQSTSARLRQVAVFWTEQQAVLATEAKDLPLFTDAGGWRALHALREQLLALDVLAEN